MPRVAPSAAHHRFHLGTVSETALGPFQLLGPMGRSEMCRIPEAVGTALAGTPRVDIAELKQQARALEQQGDVGEALAVYRQILSALDAIGGIRQELPLLIKIGDLQLKAGDVDGAVDMYERAASEYATQGAAQPVMSLGVKIVRADPQAVGAYLRLARRLLDNGFTDGARDVLMDYAQRAKLEKTREGLERLAGHAEDEVKRVLAKAIDAAEERVPKRTPYAERAASSEPAPSEEEAEEPPPEPPTPKKRLTVPVGALDAEPEPDLLQQHPPEPRPEPKLEDLFPTAADLQAPAAPHGSPRASPPVAPPLPTGAPVAPPLPTGAPVVPPLRTIGPMEPPKIETLPFLPETAPPLPPGPAAPAPPPLRASQQLVFEPSFEPPTPEPSLLPPAHAAEPRREEPVTRRPSRPSRPHARPSQVATAAPRPSRRPAPRWLGRVVGLVVVLGGVGALLWFRVIPLDRLRNLLPQRQPEPVQVRPEPRRPVQPAPDTVMARDTAAAAPVAAPTPRAARRPAPPPRPPTLPPGVVLSGTVYVVSGFMVESVEEISPDNRLGFRIAQVLDSGQRIMLEEFPAESSVEGEIGVSGLPGDTVVAHVRIGGVDVTLKGVIPEALAVDLLQRLVQVRPQD